MSVYYYTDCFVFTQVFSLPVPIFPRAAIYIPVRFIRLELTHQLIVINSLFYVKTQNLCLFASHEFWSPIIQMEMPKITPDTARVQTCSITNTTFWEIWSSSTGLPLQLAPLSPTLHVFCNFILDETQ